MRIWHRDLLPYLPKSQLLAQKRECDLIWKDIANGKQTLNEINNYEEIAIFKDGVTL